MKNLLFFIKHEKYHLISCLISYLISLIISIFLLGNYFLDEKLKLL